MRKGFFQIGLIVLISSVLATGYLIKNFKSTDSDPLLAKGCSNSGTSCCKGWTYYSGVGCCPTGGPDACSKLGSFTCVKDPYVSECKLVAPGCPKGKQYAYQAVKHYSTTEELMKDPRCKPDKPQKTPTPKPTKSPSPSPSPSPKPTKSPSPTATSQPSPTATAGIATATPIAKSYLKICKYKDQNGNGNKDSEDKAISWVFNYDDIDSTRRVETNSWRLWDKGCVKVEVPVNKNITVSEEGKSGWELTAIYQDSNKVSGGNYIYNSESGKTKEVWFLNKVNESATPVPGEPNDCNGTCGSNSNCKSGLYCYEGYCRNPQNPQSTSCNNPEVLSATAPPVLPKTGANTMLYALGYMLLAGTGIYLYKKFKLA